MSIYRPEIGARSKSPKFAGKADGANVAGTSASFACGSFVRFYLRIGVDDLNIEEISFKTNGCGYAVAAADRIAEFSSGKTLTDLGGLADIVVDEDHGGTFSIFPEERVQCIEICLDALRNALADFRSLRIAEFAGEKALICTCFGIDEETIERSIAENSFGSVAEVTALTNAGSGCGSCRMLIQEMIDGGRMHE